MRVFFDRSTFPSPTGGWTDAPVGFGDSTGCALFSAPTVLAGWAQPPIIKEKTNKKIAILGNPCRVFIISSKFRIGKRMFCISPTDSIPYLFLDYGTVSSGAEHVQVSANIIIETFKKSTF
jgi:hypothetical protein